MAMWNNQMLQINMISAMAWKVILCSFGEVDVLGCPLCAVWNGDFQMFSSIGNWHMPKRGVSGHGNHRWFKFQVFLLLSNLIRCGWHLLDYYMKAMQKEEKKNLLGILTVYLLKVWRLSSSQSLSLPGPWPGLQWANMALRLGPDGAMEGPSAVLAAEVIWQCVKTWWTSK